MPRADRDMMQLDGLKLRFSQLREGVGYLKKLADRQGVDAIETIDDVVPLLFEHTVYKSYPSSLLEKSRFPMINSWLGKLTTVPIGEIDVSKCDSIDSWIATMDAESDLCLHHSSGTSGTVSLFSKVKARALRFRQTLSHAISKVWRSASGRTATESSCHFAELPLGEFRAFPHQ